MITYEKLWETMKAKNMNLNYLLKHGEIRPGQVERLRKNCFVSPSTIHRLCQILDCQAEDILEYRDDASESSGTNQ